MSNLILQPTSTAGWQSLVKEAEDRGHLVLHEDLESYLIFLLVRFTGRPDMAKSVMALEYLHGLEAIGQRKAEALRDVGDKCLLFSGLFPHSAEWKHVKISYFVNLGQGAYSTLAGLTKLNISKLYGDLCKGFVGLMDVLQVIRELADLNDHLTPLQAEELWQDTASAHALAVLRRHTSAGLVSSQRGNKH